jgi:hypothetical protein
LEVEWGKEKRGKSLEGAIVICFVVVWDMVVIGERRCMRCCRRPCNVMYVVVPDEDVSLMSVC